MIGIYGGTFDPVHYGHLRTALEVKEALGLEQMRMIPSFLPPHRDMPSVTGQQRYEMLQLAIQDHTELISDDRELQRGGPSYMVDTLKSLRSDFPSHALYLIIGSDAFEHLTGWHRWRQLFEFAHIVVMSRPSCLIDAERLSPFYRERVVFDREQLQQFGFGYLFFQPVTQLAISASQIRSILMNRGNARYLLPDAVLDYIYQHRLYQDVEAVSLNE